MGTRTVIVAIRNGRSADDSIEVLCLKQTSPSRFLIFSTILGDDLRESDDDLLPVEFESPYDPDVTTLLIESFWRIEVSEQDIDAACRLLSSGRSERQLEFAEDKGQSLRSFGPLLANLLDQLTTIRVGQFGASAIVRRISNTLAILASLPYLTSEEQQAIHSAQRSAIELESQLKLYKVHRET